MDLSRRGFMQVGVVALASLQTGDVHPQLDPRDEYEFQGAADLMGPASARPVPGSDFFDNKTFYAYRYTATDTGEVAEMTQDDDAWRQLPINLKQFQFPNLPTSPALGTLVFDEDHGTPAWWDVDHWEWPTFVDDVLTSAVTVADTTTRTTVFDPGINADSLIKGRTYQLDLFGQFGTTNTSSTFTVDINLGPATDAAGVGNVGGNVSDAPWSVEFTFTVRDHGTNGTLQPHTRGLFDSEPADSHHDPVSVDTTTVTELSVDIQWDTADPANTVTLGQAHLKQMA